METGLALGDMFLTILQNVWHLDTISAILFEFWSDSYFRRFFKVYLAAISHVSPGLAISLVIIIPKLYSILTIGFKGDA